MFPSYMSLWYCLNDAVMYRRLKSACSLALLTLSIGCGEPEPPKERMQPPVRPFSPGTFDRRDDPVPATEAAALADAKRELARMYGVSFVEARDFAVRREEGGWLVIATPKPGFDKQKTTVRIGKGFISVSDQQ
jgi:hypothetical protein